MDFAALKEETRRQLRESDCVGTFFGEQDIRDAVNDGYLELSDESEWFEEEMGLPLMKDRPYYDLFSIIGPIFLSIKPAFDEETNRWMNPSHVRLMDDRDRRWERNQGRPQRIFMRDLRWLGAWPRTPDDGTYVKTYYTRLPELLCEDTDEPGFPEAFHMGCVYFALADLYAQDGETALALAAWADYQKIEAALTRWVDARIGRPVFRAMGAQTGPR